MSFFTIAISIHERKSPIRVAVVATKSTAQLLLIPEVRSSNPVINILYVDHLFAAVNCIEMTKIKKKRTGISHLIKCIYFVGIK